MESLGARIRSLVEEKGVTPYEVSRKTGVSQSTLSRVLNNNTVKMSINNMELLAEYFDVGYDWLSTGRGVRERSEKEYIRSAGRLPKTVDNDAAPRSSDYVASLIEANARLAYAVDRVVETNNILAKADKEQQLKMCEAMEKQTVLMGHIISLLEGRGVARKLESVK